MSPSTPKPPYNVAVLVYDGADLLDFAGPMEMLSHFSPTTDLSTHGGIFSMDLIGSTRTIRAGGCITVNTDTLLGEARQKIDDYDILLVPGGEPDLMKRMAAESSPEVEFVREFTSHSAAEGRSERTVLSVCTGALFVGAVGALAGLKAATTHHLMLPVLREMCEKENVEVRSNTRFVDGGMNRQGVRCIFAGGITCGLDAAMYLGQMKTDVKTAEFVAKMAEYQWRRD